MRHKLGDVTELPYQFSIPFLVEFLVEKWSTIHRQSCSSQSAQQLCLWVVDHFSIENSIKDGIESWYGNSVASPYLWRTLYSALTLYVRTHGVAAITFEDDQRALLCRR